jgi:putative component of toxin-antitoxin plasmid stabilization module
MGCFHNDRPMSERAIVSASVSELRIFYGSGYRVYFIQQHSMLADYLIGWRLENTENE